MHYIVIKLPIYSCKNVINLHHRKKHALFPRLRHILFKIIIAKYVFRLINSLVLSMLCNYWSMFNTLCSYGNKKKCSLFFNCDFFITSSVLWIVLDSPVSMREFCLNILTSH